MSDRYASFTASPLGKLLVKNLGLPDPVPLQRWTEGAALVDGTVAVGGAMVTPDRSLLSSSSLRMANCK